MPEQSNKFKPLVRTTKEGRKTIEALSRIGYRLAQNRIAYRQAQLKTSLESELKGFCEWDLLRLQQLEILESRLLPLASLRREKEDGNICSLKIAWEECGEMKTRTVNPLLDIPLSESIYYRGDTLLQIFHVAEVGFREFKNPAPDKPGTIPLWIKEWEDSDYNLDFMPPSFPAFADVQDY